MDDSRLNAVLEILGEVRLSRNYHWLDLRPRQTVHRALLKRAEGGQRVQLMLWPADTLTQARALYSRPAAASRVLALRDHGWQVRPNFHFGFRESGLVWTKVDAPVEEYVTYWCEQIGGTGVLRREDGEWDEYWKRLEGLRFARTDDRAEFDKHFTYTGHQTATPRPGLMCIYSWDLPEAERLDADGKGLAAAVAEQVNVILRALGEEPLSMASAGGTPAPHVA